MALPTRYDAGLKPAPAGRFSQTMNYLLGLLGPAPSGYQPRTQRQLEGEAQRFVSAQTLPLIDQINKSIESRARSGSQGITGYTQTMMGKLQAAVPQVGAAYDTAQQQQQQADKSLMDWGAAHGLADQQQLAQKSADAGVVNPETAKLQAASSGEAAAGAAAGLGAIGHADLTRLISQRASDVSAAEKMPGVFALGGQNALRDLQLNLSQEQQDRIAEVNARAPGLAAQIMEQLQERELRKSELLDRWRQSRASLGANTLDRFEDRELQKSLGRQGFGLEAARIGLSQQELNEAIRHNQATEGLTQQEINAAAAGGRSGGLGAEDYADAQSQALNDLGNLYEGLVETVNVPGYAVKNGKRVKVGTPGSKPVYIGADGKPFLGKKKPSWSDAYRQGYARVSGPLREMGFTEQQIQQIVTDAMIAAGIQKPKPQARGAGRGAGGPQRP